MDITPARYPSSPDRPTVTAELRARRHAVLASAEVFAGIRELLRGEGDEYAGLVKTLERVEPHLVWSMERLDEVAGQLEARGWRPEPIPPPPRGGVEGLPGWRDSGPE